MTVFDLFVEYAPDKDNLHVVAGTAHVRVVAETPETATLVAQQMVAAVGLEPVAATLSERTSGAGRRSVEPLRILETPEQ